MLYRLSVHDFSRLVSVKINANHFISLYVVRRMCLSFTVASEVKGTIRSPRNSRLFFALGYLHFDSYRRVLNGY